MGRHKKGEQGPFLGTGFFTGKPPILVTCWHVLSNWKEQCYGISARDHPGKIFPADVIATDESKDLALLKVSEYSPSKTLELAEDKEITLNQIACCFEYGTTTTSGEDIDFSPANRVGNVVRLRNLTDRYKEAGENMLEMSFPALRGASGAPVMHSSTPYRVWGVVTANTAYEIHPAQVERIADDDGKVKEETRFYLPQALAIHVSKVRALISQNQGK